MTITIMSTAYILGTGPGLGAALARRFAREGFSVALMARSASNMDPFRDEITKSGGRAMSIAVDATDEASIKAGFDRAASELGPADVFVYNAGMFKMAGVLDVSPDEFEKAWRANCFGAFVGAQRVLPAMLAKKRGTILLTGATASMRGGARFSCVAVGKFGLRALAQSLAREFQPQGIHVAHVVVDGQIDLPRTRQMFPGRATETFLSPDAIAEAYWQLHLQDPTSWTHEIDVRPMTEKW
jgi:NAD(P)-dependent dehydrogenase (short-subunit alcohol dehydrogenase family)